MALVSKAKVASRHLFAANCKKVESGARKEYLDVVWEMYAKTYARIGLHIASPQGLLKYDVWEVCFDSSGNPVQFTCFKKTPYGLKSGLSGHDGSVEGKRYAVDGLRTKFKKPGYFGEVSHKVLEIVLAAGAPVVCAVYAQDVLKKNINPVDSLLYQRSLPGVGNVTKMMVGKPKGVPTTNVKSPSCPIPNGVETRMATEEEDFCDEDSHLSCLALEF